MKRELINMKPKFSKKGKEIVFIDSSGTVWRADNLQDLVDGYKKFLAFEGIKNHYFYEFGDEDYGDEK